MASPSLTLRSTGATAQAVPVRWKRSATACFRLLAATPIPVTRPAPCWSKSRKPGAVFFLQCWEPIVTQAHWGCRIQTRKLDYWKAREMVFFKYADTAFNRSRGVVGLCVTFENNASHQGGMKPRITGEETQLRRELTLQSTALVQIQGNRSRFRSRQCDTKGEK